MFGLHVCVLAPRLNGRVISSSFAPPSGRPIRPPHPAWGIKGRTGGEGGEGVGRGGEGGVKTGRVVRIIGLQDYMICRCLGFQDCRIVTA